ncbi:uncharacterized protein LOC123317054 [Coccinella septempunctata]|uniref:uncharacterized protein LOC123317054 n=1 Tax=Coccinella septempunctata TaxID=41139 RepID=UPI001D097B0C|nr:uncharacterized protein LOC123317054 [Coccinella septempunctata]
MKEHFFLHQAETVFVILAGVAALVIDSSFITFSKDMEKLWRIALDPYKFPPLRQMYLKYYLSMLVIVRTFTVHLTIALYVVMLWPALFTERAYLLIPWIVVGTIRLCVNVLGTVAGFYICSKYGVISTLWIEFLFAQLLQHGPFFYAWLTIINYRLDLREIELERAKVMEQEVYQIKLCKKSRQKLMASRGQLLDDRRDTISFSTLTTIIQRISDRKKDNLSTRSLDTLLEIIEGGHPHEETNSIISATSSTKTDLELIKSLQITEEDIQEVKRNTLDDLNYGLDEASLMISEGSA